MGDPNPRYKRIIQLHKARKAQLMAAQKRIAELEAELKKTRDGIERQAKSILSIIHS